jgi:UDP-2,3-diacylglucosamine hydrolase
MIALIAGTGALPGLLADALVQAGDPPVICEMAGFEPDVRADLPRLRFRIETLGTLLATLKTAGVTRICMAGAVRRPVIDATAIDALTAPLVPALQAFMAKGDDGTLRGIIAILEGHGFRVVGADQIAPELLPPAGVLTRHGPSAVDLADAEAASQEIVKMGLADLGQACVVRAGIVVAREAEAGTDAMLAGLCDRSPQMQSQGDPLLWAIDQVSDLISGAADWLAANDELGRSSARTGDLAGVLFKAPKPGQDRRADLPVIGPQTAMLAAEAGLTGIVIAAGGVMVIDQPQVVSILDGQGMFLWVRP